MLWRYWLTLLSASAAMACLPGASIAHSQAVPGDQPQRVLYITYVPWSADRRSPQFDTFVSDLFQHLKEDDRFRITFSDKDYLSVEYTDSPLKVLTRSCIGFLSARKYAELSDSAQHEIDPLFVLTNGDPPSAYYSGAIVASRKSTFTTLDSDQIQNVYHLGPGSLTGYISPLDYLWRNQLIESPDLDGLKGRGWTPHGPPDFDRSEDVRLRVADDEHGIGFIWYQPEKLKNLRVLARFGLYPNEVVFITNDLKPYRDRIASFLLANSAGLQDAPLHASGLQPWSDEYANAIRHIGLLGANPGRHTGIDRLSAPWLVVPLGIVTLCTSIRILRSTKIWRRNWTLRRRMGRCLLITFSSVIDACVLLSMLVVLALIIWLPTQPAWGTLLLAMTVEPAPPARYLVLGPLMLVLGVVVAAAPVFTILIDRSPQLIQRIVARIGGDHGVEESTKDEAINSSSGKPVQTS